MEIKNFTKFENRITLGSISFKLSDCGLSFFDSIISWSTARANLFLIFNPPTFYSDKKGVICLSQLVFFFFYFSSSTAVFALLFTEVWLAASFILYWLAWLGTSFSWNLEGLRKLSSYILPKRDSGCKSWLAFIKILSTLISSS